MEILQMSLETNTNEFGSLTIVTFILLGLIVQIIQELVINAKK